MTKTMLRTVWMAVGMLVCLEGCVLSPYDGETIPYNGTTGVGTASMYGYADTSNTAIVVKIKDQIDGSWDTLAVPTTLRSAVTQSYAPGAWGIGSPALYYYAGTVTLLSPSIVDNSRHWDPATGRITLKVTKSNGSTLYGGTQSAISCFIAAASPSKDFKQTAYDCNLTQSEIVVYRPLDPIP